MHPLWTSLPHIIALRDSLQFSFGAPGIVHPIFKRTHTHAWKHIDFFTFSSRKSSRHSDGSTIELYEYGPSLMNKHDEACASETRVNAARYSDALPCGHVAEQINVCEFLCSTLFSLTLGSLLQMILIPVPLVRSMSELHAFTT